MRKMRIGALAASAALASVTIVGGAGTAMAQEETDTVTVNSEGNYTMTATALGDCQVEFTLESEREDNYGNWRGDFRVNNEDPITAPGSDSSVGNRGETFRPVVGSNQGIEDAIENDLNYDFETGEVIVDLSEDRTVPDFEGGTTNLSGVEPNESGEHTVTFGVYQGPVGYTEDVYNTDGEITVYGCETEGGLGLGSLDVFGSIENLSS